MRFTLTALLATAAAVQAAPAPNPAPDSVPQKPTICQQYPGGYWCIHGINGPDSIGQCNPAGGWFFIGDCRSNEKCVQTQPGIAYCVNK